jgi:hypothetical protein
VDFYPIDYDVAFLVFHIPLRGGNTAGSGVETLFNGETFARQGVVSVPMKVP